MNKQEVIEKIKNLEGLTILDKTINFDSEMISKKEVFNIINQIDEPEKPVLTKKEAEWVDKLTEFFDTPNALYYITRCGYSEYSFTFDFWGDTYELPIEYGELNKLKERLVNAVLYGYEVEKDKFYTAKLKSTGEYLHYDSDENKFHHTFAFDDVAKKTVAYHFTKDELVKYSAWENDFYDVDEVEE